MHSCYGMDAEQHSLASGKLPEKFLWCICVSIHVLCDYYSILDKNMSADYRMSSDFCHLLKGRNTAGFGRNLRLEALTERV